MKCVHVHHPFHNFQVTLLPLSPGVHLNDETTSTSNHFALCTQYKARDAVNRGVVFHN